MAIVLGAAGLLLALVSLLRTPGEGSGMHFLVAAQRGLSVCTKLSLIATGVLLMRRSAWAAVMLAVTLALSVADSVVAFLWLLPPVPEGLSGAARAGRVSGRVAGLVGGPVLYVVGLVYLMVAGRRGEFQEG